MRGLLRAGTARGAAGLACAALLFGACGHAPPKPATAPGPKAKPLHAGPLTDFVPAAGVRWLVVGRPREIANDPRLAAAVLRILPEKRLSAFAGSSGVDLRTVPSGLIAGFDFATLYMGEIAPTAASSGSRRSADESIRSNFERRLVTGARVKTPHPDLRLVTGVVGRTPETLLIVRERLFAVAVGDPSPATIAAAFAQERLKRSPPILAGSALSTLPRKLEQAPVRFYAPGPFDESEWANAGQGLFAAALAFGVAVEPRDAGTLEATLVLSGDFSSAQAETVARAEAAWNAFATSSPGHLFGLDAPALPPKVTLDDKLLELRVRLRLEPIVRGLRAAVSADAWEILDISKSQAEPNSAPQ